MQNMNLYLQDLLHFDLETNHKALIPILNSKPLAEQLPHIQ